MSKKSSLNITTLELLDLYKNINDNILDDYHSSFEVISSGIGEKGIHLKITTKNLNPLPEILTNLFFEDIDLKFKVKIEELPVIKKKRTFYIIITESI